MTRVRVVLLAFAIGVPLLQVSQAEPGPVKLENVRRKTKKRKHQKVRKQAFYNGLPSHA